MTKRAREGTCLARLVKMGLPILRQAERQCPRTGPGQRPTIPEWVIAALIMIAVLHRKKSKSAQYRFLHDRRAEIASWLGTASFPCRSTYFRRYRRGHRLQQKAIALQGEKGIQEGLADPQVVAADKSLLAARGPLWHKSDRKVGKIPKGVDQESTWGYSEYHGWVQGYSYEFVVTATADNTIWPLLASVDTASMSEHATFGQKIDQLPSQTEYVLTDSGYDNNEYGERIEYREDGRPGGRHFLCPENPRGNKRCRERRGEKASRYCRKQAHQRRRKRQKFLASKRGQALHARRRVTIEPLNDWFKSLFELEHRVWHRGLDNNRTQLLTAVFCYQLLLRYNHRYGRRNNQVRWILDAL